MNKEKLKNYIIITHKLENIYFSNEEIENLLKKKGIRKMKPIEQTITFTTWEDYLIEGTTVLKNIPNIEDKHQLENYEKQTSAERLIELYEKPISGEFDLNHLMNIHKYIFGDVYEWAGQIRTVGIKKQTTIFCEPEKIELALTATLEETKKDILKIQNKQELSNLITTLFYQLIYIHPFREGNGRTIREFIRQLINSLEFEFGCFDIDYELINKEILALCLTSGLGMANMFLVPEFMKALIKKEKQKTIILIPKNIN